MSSHETSYVRAGTGQFVGLPEWALKQSNPKDIVAGDKLPLALVPDTVTAYAALAFAEGALKYGPFNWRSTGVRMSVYLDALERHLSAFRNGEWEDPCTFVPHLASALACIGIILDAKLCGKLDDDRPAAAPVKQFIDVEAAAVYRHLKRVFQPNEPATAPASVTTGLHNRAFNDSMV